MSRYMLTEALLLIFSCLLISLHKPPVCMVVVGGFSQFNLYYFERQITAIFKSCMEHLALS